MAERDEAAGRRDRDLDEAPDGDAADDDEADAPPPATAPRRAGASPRAGSPPHVNTGVQGASKHASPSRSGAETREVDLELVRRAQKGDVKAFEDLLGRYRRKVFGLAMGMVGNRDDAMDVLQDAFVRVYRHLGSFQGDSSFYTWLYRITMNLCIDHVRKAARMRAAPYEDRLAHENVDQGDFPVLPVRHDVNPGRAARRHEAMAKLVAALDTLPQHHRAVIVMREFEGLTYEEMAQVMQVPKGTIMSRLFHARHKLQKALAEFVDGEISVV
ncbi:MAG: sigma-70 family RNA polymerase sigma factor [Deltaproteobacteria bacterium]|nr:sigma-70 family RNA polymerase sigma factor [Deltaproteobacteria bacterium]